MLAQLAARDWLVLAFVLVLVLVLSRAATVHVIGIGTIYGGSAIF